MKVHLSMVASSLLLGHGALHAAAVTYYAQLAPVTAPHPPPGQPGGPVPSTNLYWKYVIDGDQVTLYDLCSGQPETPLGTAKGDANGWVLGNQRVSIDSRNILRVTADDRPYAQGDVIEPITCDARTRVPTTQPKLLSTGTPQPAPPGGRSSGSAHIEAARGWTLKVSRPVAPTPGRPATTEPVPTGTLNCAAAPVTEAAVTTLTDSPALARNAQFWPGNLLQGRDLAEGKFTPITLRRSGGTLTVSGLTFADGGSTTTDVTPRMSEGGVADALNRLLSQKVAQTQATVSFVAKTVYSDDQLAFSLGVDGRFSNASFKAAINVDTSGKKNTVLARFMQVYYTVSFEDPESAYSVFNSGKDVQDDEDQIGADNPPLYIKQVSYGRTIYFLASSTESATAVKAALEGAYGNKDAGNYIGMNSTASYKSVMANTSVAYFALGGDAVTAVTPITATDPEKMYDAVKAVMADKASAEVGQFNRGLPVAYSISYLANRSPASMGYATSYDQTECKIVPTGYYSFTLEQTCVDDSVNISVLDRTNIETPVVSMGSGFSGRQLVTLDSFMPQKDEDVTVRVLEYNVAGPWCSNFRFKRQFTNPQTQVTEVLYLQPDGSLAPQEAEIRRSGGWLVGNQSDYRIRVNRATGNVLVTNSQ